MHEFTPAEWGRRVFCYEQNHLVLLTLCGVSFSFPFHPDLSAILDDLPNDIRQLADGERIWLPFPESSHILNFTPTGDEMRCEIAWQGQEAGSQTCTAPKLEIVATLRVFVTELTQRMVTGSYLTQAQADEYLAPLSAT